MDVKVELFVLRIWFYANKNGIKLRDQIETNQPLIESLVVNKPKRPIHHQTDDVDIGVSQTKDENSILCAVQFTQFKDEVLILPRTPNSLEADLAFVLTNSSGLWCTYSRFGLRSVFWRTEHTTKAFFFVFLGLKCTWLRKFGTWSSKV